MYLIVGLGNIGSEYNLTRHNIGFEAIDYISEKSDIKINKMKFKADYGKGRIGNEDVFLVKPRTYMNLSGESVKLFKDYFKIPDENIFIIYDDIELPKGKLRIRKSGGSGTHNGMKSIVKELNTKNFPRFRLGVGSPEHGDLINYVLGKFRDEEIPVIRELIVNTQKAVFVAVEKDLDKAMNLYNKK
ncbi:aminoacyl-tRNA hydrolase [Anaerofustis sp.]|uniref:aminoacyl-tRNA hydrolase n=1 Tax=Anaerofustis sp. TaxID=1872517 RepID=UPI0025C68792|nr:aminoacyl-tRNA hydrolase [Anaerofustis sp.]